MSTTKEKTTTTSTTAPDADTPPTTPEPSVRAREAQDREIANGIAEARHALTTLQEDSDVRTRMTRRGYDTQEINTGLALQIAAQATFNDRQKAMGEQEACRTVLEGTIQTARVNYADFRRVARAKYKVQADRMQLGLVGVVPPDDQQFITVATASYAAAGKPPYLAILSKKGYDAAALEGLMTGLKNIETAVKDHKKATAAGQEATRLRDTAWGVLKRWMGELRETAKVAFRDAPEQAAKLDY